ncbi:MAG: hypothetical protein EXX96DRAFT_584944 [Benjaminiella poitrasii]|nr:MAG: hypothetical protein EXX96DRAFT_584944 [Benjaminiella poitrasii]
MNTTMNNAAFGFEPYNFMPAPYPPTKMDYYDAQIYSPTTPTTPGFPGYETVVPSMVPNYVPQPMVPSQIDMYSSMPSSPESVASASCSPSTSSLATSTASSPSVSPSEATTPSSLPSCMSLTEKINKRIAQVNTLPDSFLPEFHQYSKETYENGGACMKRRRRRHNDYSSEGSNAEEYENSGISAAELRRQVHIQSEQKRRAQIKDGFEVLRQHLPGCANKKMSKAALLHRTVQHLQHLKKNQASILTEIERLVQENEKLKAQQQQRVFI